MENRTQKHQVCTNKPLIESGLQAVDRINEHDLLKLIVNKRNLVEILSFGLNPL